LHTVDKPVIYLYYNGYSKLINFQEGTGQMTGYKINTEIMEYMVWVIELTANEFFNGNKTLTYNTLKGLGIWDLFVQNYDITHTLGASYVMDEINEILLAKKVL